MSNFVMCEYVNVNFCRRTDSGQWVVHYEPIENGGARRITGLIYVNGDAIQSIDVSSTGSVRLSPNQRSRRALSGKWLTYDQVFVLTFARDPGEHFLCISYEFEDALPTGEKANWLTEGF